MDHALPTTAEELQILVRGGRSFRYLLFFGHRAVRRGGIGRECLSQSYDAPFELDGLRFATAAHYLMWRKATLAGDASTAEAILRARTPGKAKALGRRVQGFQVGVWNAQRRDVAVQGNLAKFRQHEALGEYLLGTGDRVLAEASPDDLVWGIGLVRNDEGARRPLAWRGENLLGFALMEVRDRLRGA